MTSQHRRSNARNGQSLIESCLAIALICLVFMGMLEVSRLLTAKQVLNHAAACGARARTVGFNDWMVNKVVHVAAIPNAGRMTTPQIENIDTFLRAQTGRYLSGRHKQPGSLWSSLLSATPSSSQYPIEISRIPEYLGSPYRERAMNILDYEDWDSISCQPGTANFVPQDQTIEVTSRQTFDNWLFGNSHKSFYSDESIELTGKYEIENHCRLYLEN